MQPAEAPFPRCRSESWSRLPAALHGQPDPVGLIPLPRKDRQSKDVEKEKCSSTFSCFLKEALSQQRWLELWFSFWLPDSANKRTGCPVKFASQTNNTVLILKGALYIIWSYSSCDIVCCLFEIEIRLCDLYFIWQSSFIFKQINWKTANIADLPLLQWGRD